MARGKKKEAALSPEERLQAALVPESEQPYQVPENWCWVTLNSAVSIIMGQSPSGTETTDDKSYTPLIGGAADMGDMYPNATRYTKVPTKLSTKQDLILCIRATLGKPVYSDKEYCLGRGVAAIRPNLGERSFYKWFFNAFEQYLYNNATGSTFAQVSSQTLQRMPLPFPPLPEQQRIVDRIESLFAKLDEAKQKAQDALDSFETRKAAILHKAFTGELTAQWRKEHGVRMESWESHPIKDIAQIGSGGTPSRKNAQYYSGDILWVKTGEICWNGICDTEEKITEEAINDSSAKLYPAGTVLVAMYGQGLTRGRAAILRVPAATNQAVCALQPCEGLKKEYLYYYFMANYWNYRRKGVGENQPNYSATMIGKWLIQIPKIKEQTEIVRILDNLLAKEQQAKEAAEKVLEQIDLTKKAILARAFRGELGTNDPSEESSVELLKTCYNG